TTTSAPVPGANGQIVLISRTGYSCAAAGAAPRAKPTKAKAATTVRMNAPPVICPTVSRRPALKQLLPLQIRQPRPLAPALGVLDQQRAHHGLVAVHGIEPVVLEKRLGVVHRVDLGRPQRKLVLDRLRRSGRDDHAPPRRQVHAD